MFPRSRRKRALRRLVRSRGRSMRRRPTSSFSAPSPGALAGCEFRRHAGHAGNEDLNQVPGLAESFEVAEDGTYTFHLRKGVLFHDGKEMTSADVKYSMDMAVPRLNRVWPFPIWPISPAPRSSTTIRSPCP